MKITAVYVTYNPNVDILNKSIGILKNIVSKIWIIDNSQNPEWQKYIASDLKQYIKIHSFQENKGIAEALNFGYKKAIEEGSEWVLSMDQDSIIDNTVILKYQDFISVNEFKPIGALMPSFFLCPNATQVIGGENLEVADYMTSGSLVNLNAYKATGGFENKLFIDLVDTDFGFKLILNGYKIYRLKEIIMHHNIGNSKDITIYGRHIFYITNHNYLRRYYITRNLLYIKKTYGNTFPEYSSPWFKISKSIIRIIFFERNKIKKIKSIILGILDFNRNRYGKYLY